MHEIDIISDGKRTCIRAIQQQNDYIGWLRFRGFSNESELVIQARESLGYWVDMLYEWQEIEKREGMRPSP